MILLDILTQIDLQFLVIVFFGVVLGIIVGAVPGLSVTMATALIVSISFAWPVKNALALIMGVYVSGVYAGAISAILINIPGAPASVATTLDGYPMARRGEASQALWTALIHSFIGSVVGLIILTIVARPITKFALAFSPIDYFLLAVFGLTTVGSLTSKSFVKGIIAGVLGIIISLVGMDPIMGTSRFTFGILNLKGGIPLISTLIGLFGFSEVLFNIGHQTFASIATKAGQVSIDFKTTIRYLPLSLKSALIGAFIGALPGAGGPIASLISYDQARRTTRSPSRPFGTGAVEGIVASEAANNGCIGGALIPMLTLAIPGDAVTAVILAAFYVHGLRPGPLLFRETPQLFHIILAGGFLASVLMFIVGVTLVPQFSKLVLIPRKILIPLVAVLCVIGAYAVHFSLFEVIVMLIFGFIGFIMRERDYSVAPMVIGLVLGEMMDSNFRRAASLLPAGDNLFYFIFSQPISFVLFILIVFSILMSIPAIKVISGKLLKRGK